MGRQRSRNHISEQNQVSGIIESSNLTDAEFKTLVIKMFNELRRNVYEFSENFDKEVENKNGNGNYKWEPVGNVEYII